MPERPGTDSETAIQDDLARYAQAIEAAVDGKDFLRAAELLEHDWASAWFSLEPVKTSEILYQLPPEILRNQPVLGALREMLTSGAAEGVDSSAFLTGIDFKDPRQVLLLTMIRAGSYRITGRITEALDQFKQFGQQLGVMQPLVVSPGGWELHVTVQVGVTAMLAGDFTQALASFTRAQMHSTIPKFAFLTRDALVKSALIHACFGNTTTAISLLKREQRITRTSSWVERHIDAHRDLSRALLESTGAEEALRNLQAISLQDIGELWPFYIVALHRVLEASGHLDELEHQLEMFDSIEFPRRDGDGLSGSVIPLKRALLAMKSGRGAEAQELLDRADQSFPYTQLLQAAAHVYAGRTQQALQEVTRLRANTRGFRLLEIRRLAILAAAQYQSNEVEDCLDTLQRATEVPRGLSPHETLLFSPETRELALKQVAGWPADHDGPSAFLTGLPKPGLALTEREVEILQLLSQGLTRAEMADEMFISVNTLKTHLKSVYRKLQVSTASDAVLGAQRRGLL
jgi:ATP/maltotriose-dependent transcriptional regulator MalT